MNILVMGAGAIGSFFGAMLSKNNNVLLVGRKNHIDEITTRGLTINGKTEFQGIMSGNSKIYRVSFEPDLILLTVKSYDTESAMKEIQPYILEKTNLISIQNGLGNYDVIKKFIDQQKIYVCITTHGVVFEKPGVITHTGVGKTTMGKVIKNNQEQGEIFVELLNESGIDTTRSDDIIKEIWIKAIVNSSINPLTSFFKCKNGALLENPVLEKMVEKLCYESTEIAKSEGIIVDRKKMLDKTIEVITDTSENYSSMYQSVRLGKKTEIDSINGIFARIGRKNSVGYCLNDLIAKSIKNSEQN